MKRWTAVGDSEGQVITSLGSTQCDKRGSITMVTTGRSRFPSLNPQCGFRAEALVAGSGESFGFDIRPVQETCSGMYEAAGKIKVINETQNFPSGFSKREFVVTTGHDKYPQDLKFEIVKDKCTLLDAFQVGQDVQVSFDIRGNEYNGKYFVNLSCWKIQGANGAVEPVRAAWEPSRSQAAASPEPNMSDLRNDEDFDDDPPF